MVLSTAVCDNVGKQTAPSTFCIAILLASCGHSTRQRDTQSEYPIVHLKQQQKSAFLTCEVTPLAAANVIAVHTRCITISDIRLSHHHCFFFLLPSNSSLQHAPKNAIIVLLACKPAYSLAYFRPFLFVPCMRGGIVTAAANDSTTCINKPFLFCEPLSRCMPLCPSFRVLADSKVFPKGGDMQAKDMCVSFI